MYKCKMRFPDCSPGSKMWRMENSRIICTLFEEKSRFLVKYVKTDQHIFNLHFESGGILDKSINEYLQSNKKLY